MLYVSCLQESQQVICGNPVNFHYGNTKTCISTAYNQVCSLLEKSTCQEEELQKELTDLKAQLDTVQQCMKDQKVALDQERKEKSDEINSLREELESKTAAQDVKIKQLSSDFFDLRSDVESTARRNKSHSLDYGMSKYRHKTGEFDEAEQEMEERRQKRKSTNLEDSLGKMKEFSANNKCFNRDRLDSGISVNSANGLEIEDKPNSP